MKVAIYARVSTQHQKESLENQIKMLKQYCKAQNHSFIVYSESVSGIKQRPIFDKLMKDIESQKFDAIVVSKLDRFSRSMIGLVKSVEKMQKYSVDFISITDNIETRTPQGKLFFHILAAFAEFEHALIQERTKNGQKRAIAEGKICHRPKKLINTERVLKNLDKLSFEEICKIEKISYSTLRSHLRGGK